MLFSSGGIKNKISQEEANYNLGFGIGGAMGGPLSRVGGRFGRGIIKPNVATGATQEAAKTGTTVFKSFTKSNFRHNLGQLTGNIPANSQAHHVFPQKYLNQFAEKGINIHDPKFGAWWNTSSHLKNASGYNEAWRQFLRTNPTQPQILDKGRQLMQQYGIPVNY